MFRLLLANNDLLGNVFVGAKLSGPDVHEGVLFKEILCKLLNFKY